MEIKIVTGKFKNRKLYAPHKKYKVKMTTSMVRKAVIDIFRNFIKDAYLLDIFAGPGSMGLEFLSNNAKEVVFIEKSYPVIQVLKRNLEKFQIPKEKYYIINKDFKDAIKILPEIITKKFNFIYIDPPFFTDYIAQSLKLLSKYDIFTDDLIIITRHHKKEKFENKIENFIKYDTRNYGSSVLDFWCLKK